MNAAVCFDAIGEKRSKDFFDRSQNPLLIRIRVRNRVGIIGLEAHFRHFRSPAALCMFFSHHRI